MCFLDELLRHFSVSCLCGLLDSWTLFSCELLVDFRLCILGSSGRLCIVG